MSKQKQDTVKYQDRSMNNPQFPLFIYYDHLSPTGNVGLHWHDEMEFVTVLKGEVELQYEGQSILLKENDVVFVNSSCVHGYQAGAASKCIPLVRPILISPALFGSNGYDIIQSRYLIPLLNRELNVPVILSHGETADNEIRNLLDAIAELFGNGAYGYEMKIKSHLYDLMYQLFLNSQMEHRGSRGMTVHGRSDSERFKKVLAFIHEHHNEKIRVRDLAEYMHMSEGHFGRYFKKMAQKTPIEYINEYKIREAARLLRETDKKEIEIAMDVGFDNFSYFISIFKGIVNCTPSQYRKSAQDEK